MTKYLCLSYAVNMKKRHFNEEKSFRNSLTFLRVVHIIFLNAVMEKSSKDGCSRETGSPAESPVGRSFCKVHSGADGVSVRCTGSLIRRQPLACVRRRDLP